MVGNQLNGLYYLNKTNAVRLLNNFTSAQNVSQTFVVACFANAKLWHCRLGHMPLDRLKYINDITCDSTASIFCNICPQAKMTRSPFPISSSSS